MTSSLEEKHSLAERGQAGRHLRRRGM